MNAKTTILFACLNGLVWIRVEGRGSFEVSPQLRDFSAKRLAIESKSLVLDLGGCPGMDSTFMGTLVAISRDMAGRTFDVVNANARNLQLLKNLGLDQIFTVDEHGERWGQERNVVAKKLEQLTNPAPPCKATTQAVMLEAHEALALTCPENETRFQDVIRYLKNGSH